MTAVRRRRFLIATAGVLAAPIASFAQQQAGSIRRIGFLGFASAGGFYTEPLERFREGLRELGYIEGRTIAFEYKFADEKEERVAPLAAELVRNKVNVIVTHGTLETRAAKLATNSIPIVMASVGDPVGAGLVASLARPGGNITGVTNMDVGLGAKRLGLLKEVVSKFSRVAVLRNPDNPSSHLQYKETQAAAQTLGIEIRLLDVRDPREFDGGFPAMSKARADALVVLGDSLFLSRRKQIASLALKNRLPSVFAKDEMVEAGGLMSYGPTLVGLYRHAAIYVDKILKGASPGGLPIEQPTKFELAINLQTAKALGITFPQSVQISANKVIQ